MGIAASLSAIGALLAQSEIPELVPQAGALGLMFALLMFMWRIQRRDRRQQLERLDALEETNVEQAKANRLCEWRLHNLIKGNRQAGIPIPDEVWMPPPWEWKPEAP